MTEPTVSYLLLSLQQELIDVFPDCEEPRLRANTLHQNLSDGHTVTVSFITFDDDPSTVIADAVLRASYSKLRYALKKVGSKVQIEALGHSCFTHNGQNQQLEENWNQAFRFFVVEISKVIGGI